MARRRNSGAFEALFGIAAMLPWWLGSILAVVAHALLHRYASADLPIHAPAGQIGQMVVSQMAKALAFYAQFIVPLVFLAGAATSFCKRRKREDLFRVFWGCTAFSEVPWYQGNRAKFRQKASFRTASARLCAARA